LYKHRQPEDGQYQAKPTEKCTNILLNRQPQIGQGQYPELEQNCWIVRRGFGGFWFLFEKYYLFGNRESTQMDANGDDLQSSCRGTQLIV
jgi:hypothetical protein